MKQTSLKILITILALSGTSIASANEGENFSARIGTTTATTTGIRAEIKDIRKETQDKIKDIKANTRDDIKGKVVEMMNRRIDNRFEKMNKRFEATIDRLTNIMSRVKTRIEKIKNAGGNTVDAEKFVTDAQTLLDLAKVGLINLKTSSDATFTLEIASTTATTTRAQAKSALENLRKISKDLEKNLQDTRVFLSKAVGSLKGQSQSHATTTVKTEI